MDGNYKVLKPGDERLVRFFNCDNCVAYNRCINDALNDNLVRCIHFRELKTKVNDAVDKVNSIGTSDEMQAEMTKALIYYINKR